MSDVRHGHDKWRDWPAGTWRHPASAPHAGINNADTESELNISTTYVTTYIQLNISTMSLYPAEHIHYVTTSSQTLLISGLAILGMRSFKDIYLNSSPVAAQCCIMGVSGLSLPRG